MIEHRPDSVSEAEAEWIERMTRERRRAHAEALHARGREEGVTLAFPVFRYGASEDVSVLLGFVATPGECERAQALLKADTGPASAIEAFRRAMTENDDRDGEAIRAYTYDPRTHEEDETVVPLLEADG